MVTISAEIQYCGSREHGAEQVAEATWIARAQQGDRDGFEHLMRRYHDTVLNLARRIIADTDGAQDLAQEVFLKAFRAIGTFRGDAAFSTWLYRITVNEAHRYLRTEHRRRARQERYDAEQPLTTPAPEIEESRVIALLPRLPEKHRVALALFYVQDLSLREIGHIMQASDGTVKSWLHRGRQRLRELVVSEGVL